MTYAPAGNGRIELDFGLPPILKTAAMLAAIVATNVAAPLLFGGPAIYFLMLLDLIVIAPLLQGLSRQLMRNNRMRHYRRSGMTGEILINGSSGNFIVVSPTERRFFADNQVFSFDDIEQISWNDFGKTGSVEIELRKDPAFVRLLMSPGVEAAKAVGRLQNLITAG